MNADDRTAIHLFDNSDEMADFMVQTWCKTAINSIENHGSFCVALSGGKTPTDFYRRLAGLNDASFWQKTHIFLVDERLVPPDHIDSNYRLLRNTFLDRIDLPPQNAHPVAVDLLNPELSAVRYEDHLKTFFRLSEDSLPRLDLVLLGIGEDGHTASLFPGSTAVNEREHLAAYVPLDEIRHDRITITLPVINSAENVVVLLQGESKARIAERVIGKRDPALPASLLSPVDGRLMFLLDREAASALPNIQT